MSEFLVKPGIVHGAYPQKLYKEKAAPERVWQRFKTSFTGLQNRYAFEFDWICRLVRPQLMELSQVPDPLLDERINHIRNSLHQRGLQQTLIVEAFALICEVMARELDKKLYDCQIFAAWIMIHGKLAQMATGEGKTLATALTACTAGLAGIPVHVITANDYLAERDASLLFPLYQRLGLQSGSIKASMTNEQRQKRYQQNIVHITGKQLAFDYLRDSLIMNANWGKNVIRTQQIYNEQMGGVKLLLRGLCFALIDEADNVLIDEAITPLIISKSIGNTELEDAVHGAIYIAATLAEHRDFKIDPTLRKIELNASGIVRIAEYAKSLPEAWQSRLHREELVNKALQALHLFEKDRHYLVREQRIEIIDEQSGRTLPDRTWEHLLHQMIEAKEGCLLTSERETIARITYQRFFSQYHLLAGTSGTLEEVAAELGEVYGLQVIDVPRNRALQRKIHPDRILCSESQKWQFFLEQVKKSHASGRPILIGSHSLADSDKASALLREAGLQHQLLNARQDQMEAEIISQAGQYGAITVATNMAGRGTDILLGKGVAELGGLHILAITRNGEARIDRQLFGRCGRQGDPGSVEIILSLDDELFRQALSKRFLVLLKNHFDGGQSLPQILSGLLIPYVQAKISRRHRSQRKQLLEQDRLYSKFLAFAKVE